MFMLGVIMASDDKLIVVEAHGVEVTLCDLAPLRVGEVFARRR